MRAASVGPSRPKLHKNRAATVESLISRDHSLSKVSQGWQIFGQNRRDIQQKQAIAITDALFVERPEIVDAILALHAIRGACRQMIPLDVAWWYG
jgi:hypothetical protein